MDRGRQQPQPRFRVRLAAGDFRRADLAVGHRVVADNALRHLAVSDRLHLQRVHAAEIGDLGEGERGFVDQPHGGGFRHQGEGHTRRSFGACAPRRGVSQFADPVFSVRRATNGPTARARHTIFE